MSADPLPEGPQEAAEEFQYPPLPELPVLVRDLPLPPELAAEVDAYCKKAGLRRAAERQLREDHVKLQYYFGGFSVAYLRTPDGPRVVAVGDVDDDDFWQQVDRLPPEDRRRNIVWTPHPRDPSISWI
jgi:hypothetical protein